MINNICKSWWAIREKSNAIWNLFIGSLYNKQREEEKLKQLRPPNNNRVWENPDGREKNCIWRCCARISVCFSLKSYNLSAFLVRLRIWHLKQQTNQIPLYVFVSSFEFNLVQFFSVNLNLAGCAIFFSRDRSKSFMTTTESCANKQSRGVKSARKSKCSAWERAQREGKLGDVTSNET